MSAALPAFITLGVGSTLLWYQHRYAKKEDEAAILAEQVETIEAETRNKLATDLHDTIAKDLAHIAIRARDLTATPGGASTADLHDLARLAAQASARIRPIILNLDTSFHSKTLTQTIDDGRILLSSRSINLAIDIPSSLDNTLSTETHTLASLVLREGTTNMLKYATPGTTATVEIALTENELTISLTNSTAPATHRQASPKTTSGYGLANLADRLQRSGGTLNFASVSDRWLLHATIPTKKGTAQ